MYKIILFLVLTKNIRVFGNDDNFGKFIDLLPEEEKEEFLDRIARRILKDTNGQKYDNSDHYKADVEINDEQLDDHDTYVKNILREETKRYKNEKSQNEFEKKEEDIGDNRDESKHIDLTLRNGRIPNINGEEEHIITSEIPYNVIPVKTIYDDINDEPKISSKNFEKSELASSKHESDNLNDKSNVGMEYSQRKSFHNDLNNVKTTTYFDNISTTENNSANKAIEERKDERIRDTASIETNHNKEESEDFNKPKKLDLDAEGGSVIDVATTTPQIQSSLHDEEDKYNSTTVTINDTEISTQNNVQDISEDFQNNVDIQNVSSNVVSSTDISDKNVKMGNLVRVTTTGKDTKNASLPNQDNKSEEKSKKDLSLRSGFKKAEDRNKQLSKVPRRGKEYEVFEVDADKSAFKSLSEVEKNNPPRYVPVYDYAYENAYFRPYDKFGLRGVEHEKLKHYDIVKEKDELEHEAKDFSRNRFSAYNNDGGSQYRMKYIYPIHTENTNMYGFMKPVQTRFKSKFNPYDYFDMDYNYNGRYILRSIEELDETFPDSGDSDHPFNSIHKSESAKDHVRAIRQLLYLKKRFGYIPEIDKELRKSRFEVEMGNLTKKSKVKTLNYDAISMDYYYDRDNDVTKGFGNMKLRVPPKVNIIIPKPSAAKDIDEVPYTNNAKYSSISNENINSLVQTEVDNKGFSLIYDSTLEVLKDMIQLNDEGLENYDWLRSAIDIQLAVRRLLDLTESLKYGEDMHKKDIELLKYCLYLFKSSKTSLDKKYKGVNFDKRERKAFLPKNRKKKKTKHSIVMWKDFAKYIRNVKLSNYEQNLGLLIEFEDFLKRILISLNDFHDAIKHVAVVTKFDAQNWFFDLKEVYLKKASKKELGAVLLHFSVLRLVENLEDDADIIEKINFRSFLEHNPKKVKVTKGEFAFVLQVLEELNRINV